MAMVVALASAGPALAWTPDTQVPAAAPADGAYPMGSPKYRTIWVDPKVGKDSRSGATRGRHCARWMRLGAKFRRARKSPA